MQQQKDQLAKAIALKIIAGQSRLAGALNKWIRHFTKKQQIWLLVVFCTLTGTGLILCPLVPGKMALNAGGNEPPTHIGSPSVVPQTTDTLTLKK